MKIHYLFLALLFSGLLSAAGKALAIIREEPGQIDLTLPQVPTCCPYQRWEVNYLCSLATFQLLSAALTLSSVLRASGSQSQGVTS